MTDVAMFYLGGVMDDRKMSIRIRFRVWLAKVATLGQVGVKLCSKGIIGCFGKQRFLFQNSQDTHRLLEHLNAFLEIHAKVHL